MIAWTDEAIEAAHNAYWAAEESPTEINEMRAALDAAVKVQFHNLADLPMIYAYEAGEQAGRAEALEEAAMVAEGSFAFDIETWMNSTKKEMTARLGNAIAAAIRALKEKQG